MYNFRDRLQRADFISVSWKRLQTRTKAACNPTWEVHINTNKTIPSPLKKKQQQPNLGFKDQRSGA